MNIRGVPSSPAVTTPISRPMATIVSITFETCKKLKENSPIDSGSSRLRNRIEKSHATIKSDETMWTWVSPIIRSIHSQVASGESILDPSTHPAKSDTTKITQKRTAGPRCGPLAHSIQRDAGMSICVRMFATSSGIWIAGMETTLATGISSVHSICTFCAPGWRLTKTSSACRRIGTLRPATCISLTVAPVGIGMACSPPRLDSISNDSFDFLWRLPTSSECSSD